MATILPKAGPGTLPDTRADGWPRDATAYLQSGCLASVPHLFLPHAGQDIKNSQSSVIAKRVRTCNGLTSVNLFGRLLSLACVSVGRRGGSRKVIQ